MRRWWMIVGGLLLMSSLSYNVYSIRQNAATSGYTMTTMANFVDILQVTNPGLGSAAKPLHCITCAAEIGRAAGFLGGDAAYFKGVGVGHMEGLSLGLSGAATILMSPRFFPKTQVLQSIEPTRLMSRDFHGCWPNCTVGKLQRAVDQIFASLPPFYRQQHLNSDPLPQNMAP
jgi:hypothetical protein